MHQEHSPPTVVTLHSGSGTMRTLTVLNTDPRNNKQQGLGFLKGASTRKQKQTERTWVEEEAGLDCCFRVTVRGQSLYVDLWDHQFVRHVICVLDGRSL